MLVIVLIALAYCQILTPLTRASDDDTLIVPGKSVGAITLGMSPAEVLRLLGDPAQSINSGWPPGATQYLFVRPDSPRDFMLHVAIDGSGVMLIIVYDKKYATRDGIAVGVSELRVQAILGNPERQFPTRYDTGEVYGREYRYIKLGLWIDFDTDGKVTKIWVLKPNSEL